MTPSDAAKAEYLLVLTNTVNRCAELAALVADLQSKIAELEEKLKGSAHD